MPDREKVIKGLECCLGANDCDVEPKEDCPYKGMCLCAMALHLDVFALLKEQEAVKPKSKSRHGANAQIQHFCGNCMTMLYGKPKYCSECGKMVKWNEQYY